MPIDKENQDQWCSKADLTNMLGLSESGIDKIRRAIGHVAESDEKPLRFFQPEWLRAWARYTAGVLDADGEAEDDDKSEWLEEKRKWDAKRSQSAYLREIGELVPLEHVQQIFSTNFEHIRKATEAMCHECRVKQEMAVARAREELARMFDNDSTSSPSVGNTEGS